MRIFKGHEKSVYAIGITPDNSFLISVSRDSTVRMWDLTTGVVQWQDRLFPPQANLAISPDGKYLATACFGLGPIFLWHLATGKRIREHQRGRNGSVAFSPESKQLAAAFQYDFAMWDTAFGKTLIPMGSPQLGIHGCVAFSPDGSRIAGGGYGQITFWEREPLKMIDRFMGLTGHPTHLAYSADGKLINAISGKHLCVWETATGRVVWEELLENCHFQAASFSPDGRTLAAAANTASVRFYDTESWEMKAEYTWKIGSVFDVAFAPDGLRIAAAGQNGKIVVWDVDE